MPTFAEAAERVWIDKSPGWRHSGHAQEWMSSLARHVLPYIGDKPAGEVTSADLHFVLRRIWHNRPETARRVRQRIHAVMEWAIALHLRDDNPCDRLGKALGAQQDLVQHMRALPHGEVAAAIGAVQASGATPAVKLAFEFLVLTAARSGEVRGAKWSEIDRAARVWTIPAKRMKSRRNHRVPLSGRAMEVLEACATARLRLQSAGVSESRGQTDQHHAAAADLAKREGGCRCRTASGRRSAIGPRRRPTIRARSSRPRWRMSSATRPRAAYARSDLVRAEAAAHGRVGELSR